MFQSNVSVKCFMGTRRRPKQDLNHGHQHGAGDAGQGADEAQETARGAPQAPDQEAQASVGEVVEKISPSISI